MLSIHLHFGLQFLVFPGTSLSVVCIFFVSSRLIAFVYLRSCTFLCISVQSCDTTHTSRHPHSFTRIFLLSSLPITCPYHFDPLSCNFLDYFSHLRCPSNSFIPYSVQLCDSTHTSQHPNFCRILCFLHCPCLCTVHT